MTADAARVALDVQYDDAADTGRAAAVVFADWSDARPLYEEVLEIRGLTPYVPGQFYRRELPCILPLIQAIRERLLLRTVVVDGYVDLSPGRPGLGRHLFESLDGSLQVIGVAKSHFIDTTAVAIVRGRSRRPLWVSSTGDDQHAAEAVRCMHGRNRIPTLLARVDALARGTQALAVSA